MDIFINYENKISNYNKIYIGLHDYSIIIKKNEHIHNSLINHEIS